MTSPTEFVHLDSAAAGRTSVATRAAVIDHLHRESTLGAYVAEAAAAPVLDEARQTLAQLLCVTPAAIGFTESATTALTTALAAWRWQSGDRVGVVPSEWGPNLSAFSVAGLQTVDLPVDGDGVLDLDGLRTLLAGRPPTIVHLTQVASHRGLVQPVAEAAAACADAGVPLWVDVAQALGHVDTAVGADVAYATSRKWLAGPRGVGVLAIAERCWASLHATDDPRGIEGLSPVQLRESHEANVAGRIGLASALRQHLEADPVRVHERLRGVGKLTREMLADVPGWSVVGDSGSPSAITALRPTGGADVFATRARLLADHRIVTTACATYRAPREMAVPLLRISPHVDVRPHELAALRAALVG